MQPTSDHQVKNEPKIAVETDRDSLSDAAQLTNRATFCIGERRNRRTEQKWRAEPNMFQAFADDARLERDDVRGDVGQFGHCGSFVFAKRR
jgi:hypothetical protein